ncbi:hypothetical protein GSI_06114 [Ganoderma sinense ZZ0214-1]|uniref:Uncharacterized protein n=1 Tax=Ganoderma sinense ZZ0214-1 TaxID=1077348 RepID=A0A2G8SCD9_9APHY|nr:hypothetical protein GSI_06114 [Ganoderma sinense ZZ0214-1]
MPADISIPRLTDLQHDAHAHETSTISNHCIPPSTTNAPILEVSCSQLPHHLGHDHIHTPDSLSSVPRTPSSDACNIEHIAIIPRNRRNARSVWPALMHDTSSSTMLAPSTLSGCQNACSPIHGRGHEVTKP